MLYGEGRKAFFRLQEEIIRIYPDLTIFAWKSASTWALNDEGPMACSVFAAAAADFSESGEFEAVNAHSTNDFTVSNQGIRIHTRVTMQGI